MDNDFKDLLKVLRSLGDVTNTPPMNRNGKLSKFKGTLKSQSGEREVRLGLLHYPWNRTIGVNKIHQALQFSENASLDGAVIVGTKFTTSAIEQAFRNNENSDKRIILMDQDEIQAAVDFQ